MKVRNKGKLLNEYVKDYVVFDLETTGIDQEHDRIIEISAVKVKNHRISDHYTTLVNPGCPIPKAATAVNGITDQMVKDAAGLKEAMADFMDFIEGAVLVGHNIHTFDTNFAYDAVMETLGKELNNDYVDTLVLSRRYLPQLSRRRLVDVSEYFGFETAGAHRALNDCIMNQKCYEELGKIMEQQKGKERKTADEPCCPLCSGPMIRRKGKYGEFYGCLEYPRCRGTRKI